MKAFELKRYKPDRKTQQRIKRRLARIARHGGMRRLRKRYLPSRRVVDGDGRRRNPTQRRPYVIATPLVRAPQCLSAVKNPNQMSQFIGELKHALTTSPKVRVDLSYVTDLAADGVALLLKHISDPRLVQNARVVGTEPLDPISRQKLIDSGFYTYVLSPRGRIGPTDAISVIARKSERVDNEIAAKVRQQATKWLYTHDRTAPSLYASLIECMANTRNHAHRNTGARNVSTEHETWWLAVSRDVTRRAICVAFIDTGVGLFESVKLRGIASQMRRLFGRYPNTQILKDMLRGEITSRTGLPYRGKGLPKIYNHLLRGDFSKLIFVTNDVFADVGADDYRTITPPFAGTLIYWEIKGDIIDVCNPNSE